MGSGPAGELAMLCSRLVALREGLGALQQHAPLCGVSAKVMDA